MHSTPPPCPHTVTVRLNPSLNRSRRIPSPESPSNSPPPTFPMSDILSIESTQNPNPNPNTTIGPQSLKVFLRVRPVAIENEGREGLKGVGNLRSGVGKCVWPKVKEKEKKKEKGRGKGKEMKSCVEISGTGSVTVFPPGGLNRSKSEMYTGFFHVFAQEAAQEEVYEKMVSPIVTDFINGRSGMLAALGPSGSGKTYTVFGTHRNPGMVPRAVRHIFSSSVKNPCKRSFYLSLFEIYSEKGKVEKLLDLSPDGGDIQLQHSGLKGLQEVLIADAAQAESLIVSGLSKRATAATSTNSQSSRSQCIINIRAAPIEINGDVTSQLDDAVLTFVDLAGAEREKKTGNQGKRLLEGNFINNTSMVLGLCLRSLLEHQKNPKQPLRKHFQSSLLTRYLRDYLEGKKRMTLILTVRPGEKDYLDTSFLLRQASPYMEIKFHNTEETTNLRHNKRHNQATPVVEQPKRMKLIGMYGCKGDEKMIYRGAEDICKDEVLGRIKGSELKKVAAHSENNPSSWVNVDAWDTNSDEAKKKREYEIMKGFTKAIWKVLKEYKDKLKVLEHEVDVLNQSLRNERTHRMELQSELIDLKFICSRRKKVEDDATSAPSETGCDSKVNDVDLCATVQEIPSVSEFIESNSCQTVSHLNASTLDLHVDIYEQPMNAKSEKKDPPSPCNRDEEDLCLIDGDFCESINEATVSLEIESTTKPEAAYLATDILDPNIETYEQRRVVESQEKVPAVDQEEEFCNSSNGSSTNVSEVASSPGIGESSASTPTSHATDDSFDLQTEIDEQPRDGPQGIEDPSSPSNEEEEMPCLISRDLRASVTELASHTLVSECNIDSETSSPTSDELHLFMEGHGEPIVVQYERTDLAISREEEDPYFSAGDSCATIAEVASIPGVGQSYPSTSTPISNDMFDPRVENYAQESNVQCEERDHLSASNHKEEPCRIEVVEVAGSIVPVDEVVFKGGGKDDDTSCLKNGDILASIEKVASIPAVVDPNTSRQTSPPAIDLIIGMGEHQTHVQSEENDPSANHEVEVPANGAFCPIINKAASNPGIGERNASTTSSYVAHDLFDIQTEISERQRDVQPGIENPPSQNDDEKENPCHIDGDLHTRNVEFDCHPGTRESNISSEALSPAITDKLHLDMEILEQPIHGQIEGRNSATYPEEKDPCCNVGDSSAIKSDNVSSREIGWSRIDTGTKKLASDLCDLPVEKSVEESQGQWKERDHPSLSNQKKEDPSCIEGAAGAESSMAPAAEVVSEGKGKENVILANGSNLTLPVSEENCIPQSQSLKEKRPRRRLMPASSVLLRDINCVELKDETDMPMGGREGGRKTADNDRKRTKGNITLLRLLKNAHR